MAEIYRIFDIALSCEFSLPELPSFDDAAPVIRVAMGEAVEPDHQGFELVFEWVSQDQRVICYCERKADEYWFVFPFNASFHLSGEGVITCYSHEDSNMQLLRHLLLNQVIPRYLATTGRLVLHAGAVTLDNGKSVAFLGNSGFGKSTLVSSFHRHGARLINDDCIMLQIGEDTVTAIGGLEGLRLFPDSVHAVFSETSGFTNYTPYTDKQQLFLKNEQVGGAPAPRVLDAIFLLNDPSESDDEAITIEEVSGSHAMMAMIQGAFSLDPSDKKTIAGNFVNVGQAINGRLGLYSLSYPRVHAWLPEVRAAVKRVF